LGDNSFFCSDAPPLDSYIIDTLQAVHALLVNKFGDLLKQPENPSCMNSFPKYFLFNQYKKYRNILFVPFFWEVEMNSYCFYIIVTHIQRIVSVGKYRHVEQVFNVYAYLEWKKNYGHVLMVPEIVRHKISELFESKDIDFSHHPDFSRKYYVRAENRGALERQISGKFMDLLCQYDDAEIEIIGTGVLIRLDTGFTLDTVKTMVRLLKGIIGLNI